MSTSIAGKLPITAAEYLEGERSSEVRHNFLDGRISRSNRGAKLANYQRIPSVKEIVYIEQDRPEIFLVRRSDRLQKHIYSQLNSPVHLESINPTITAAAFYQSSPFPDDVVRP